MISLKASGLGHRRITGGDAEGLLRSAGAPLQVRRLPSVEFQLGERGHHEGLAYNEGEAQGIGCDPAAEKQEKAYRDPEGVAGDDETCRYPRRDRPARDSGHEHGDGDETEARIEEKRGRDCGRRTDRSGARRRPTPIAAQVSASPAIRARSEVNMEEGSIIGSWL